MKWIRALSREDLPPATRRVSQVGDRAILLINHQGEIYAVGNRCPHMGATLENGEVTATGEIVCPRHRSVFHLETGEVEDWVPWPPVVGRVLGAGSQQASLPTYPTKIEDEGIWVGIEVPG